MRQKITALLLGFLLFVGCGKTHVHNYGVATCTSPKTFTVCGETEGTNLSHEYHDGECKSCGEPDPNHEPIEEMVWIPRTGKRFHEKSNCGNMSNPSYVTMAIAEARGFTPCQNCY